MNGFMPGQQWMDDLGSYAPLASGIPFQPQYGTAGVPFMGGGGLPSMAMNLFGMPLAQGAMNRQGMMPFGFHDQNAADYMRNRGLQDAYKQSMAAMAQFERENAMRLIRAGTINATGTWTQQQQQAAMPVAQALGSGMSMLALMAPDVADSLGGYHGSASVMAQRMHMGGRYRLDPVTGMMGMGQNSTQALTGNLYDRYFGNDMNLNETQGFTAGQWGSMYGALNQKGMVLGRQMSMQEETRQALREMAGSPQETFRLDQAAKRAGVNLPADLNQLGAGDLDKLRGTAEVGDKLKGFDAKRVEFSLRKHAEVLRAMSDIFGDQGNPNAPIPALLEGLEKLTHGTSHQIDPQRLGTMVRNLRSISNLTGVPMDAVQMMSDHAAAGLQRAGLEVAHAPDIAFGSAAWGGAFRAMGGSAVASWRRMSADQFTQADANLRVAATGSETYMKLAALMSARQAAGGHLSGPLEDIALAVESGTAGQLSLKELRGGNFQRNMMAATGMSASDLTTMMQDRPGLEGVGNKYGLTNQVREHQPQQVEGWLRSRARGMLRKRILSASGGKISRAEADRIASQGAAGLAASIAGMSDPELADIDVRKGKYGDFLQQAVAGTEAAQYFQNPSQQANLFNTELDQASRKRFGGKDVQNVVGLMNKERFGVAGDIAAQAKTDAIIDKHLGVVGKGGMMTRLIDAAMEEGGSPEKAILSMLGAIDKKDVGAAMAGSLSEIVGQQKAMDELKSKLATASGPEKQRILKQMEAQGKIMGHTTQKFLKDMESGGISIDAEGRIVRPEDREAMADFGKKAEAAIEEQLKSGRDKDGNKLSNEEYAALRGQQKALQGMRGKNLAIDKKALAAVTGTYQYVAGLDSEKRAELLKGAGISEEEFGKLGKTFGLDAVKKGGAKGEAGGGMPSKMEIEGKLKIEGANMGSIQAILGEFGIGG